MRKAQFSVLIYSFCYLLTDSLLLVGIYSKKCSCGCQCSGGSIVASNKESKRISYLYIVIIKEDDKYMIDLPTPNR